MELAVTGDDIELTGRTVSADDVRKTLTKEARKRLKRASVKLDKLGKSVGVNHESADH